MTTLYFIHLSSLRPPSFVTPFNPTFKCHNVDRKTSFKHSQTTSLINLLPQASPPYVLTIFPRPPSPFQLQPFVNNLAISFIFNLTAYFIVLRVGLGPRILTPSGLIHAGILGVIIYTAFGLPGWILTLLFLIVGSITSKLGLVQKEKRGIADHARTPAQVWGAGGAAAMFAILRMVGVLADEWAQIGFVGAMATKVMDTVSSEIGKAYGGTTVVLPSLKVVERGTEGGISAIGTLAGVLSAVIAGLVALWGGFLMRLGAVRLIVAAALTATTVESWIGANMQQRWKWSNEFVNFLNTSIGAIIAIALFRCHGG